MKKTALSLARSLSLAFALTIGSVATPARAETGYPPPAGKTWPQISNDYWKKIVEKSREEGKTCPAGGTRQSPIDITTNAATAGSGLAAIKFNYPEFRLRTQAADIVNTGHTVEVSWSGEWHTIVIDNEEYQLAQYHFHSPSEHRIDGRRYAMEQHLVHVQKNVASPKRVVVAVLFDIGKESPRTTSDDNYGFRTLFRAFSRLGTPEDPKKSTTSRRNVELDWLPKDKSYYRYAGSLTTPACNEDVTWLVLKTPVFVSQPQVDQLTTAVGYNARPIQTEHNTSPLYKWPR